MANDQPNDDGGAFPKAACMPCGCMTVMVLGLLLLAASQYFTLRMVEDSVPYQHALKMATEHQATRTALGPPIHVGIPEEADIHMQDDQQGTVRLVLPLTGTKAEGTLTAEGRCEGQDNWIFSTLHLTVDGHQHPINLLPPDTAP